MNHADSENARAHGMRVLEFQQVREAVAGYALSEEGRSAVMGAEPLWEAVAAQTLRDEVSEWVRLLESGAVLPLETLPPVQAVLPKLEKEGLALDIEELFALGLWCRSCSQLRAFLGRCADYPALVAAAQALPDSSEPSKIVFAVLTKDGELRDLPALHEIRRSIARIRASISAAVARYLSDEGLRPALQSDLPTQRNGRTVLAVKAGSRSRIHGIVHESSATGQTVYVEPEEVVEGNNALVAEEARLKAEIHKILRETSERLRPMAALASAAVDALTAADALIARARYTARNHYQFAETCTAGMELFKARHPLLGSRAVPIDLELPATARALIISGPNTGGKTVTLKTAGLLALMNQFGLGIPVAPRSRLPHFSGIYADIGDEQSLSQSLSTFSGHMRNVAEIARQAGPESLVLLDELGSGTDPEEGSAIGMALLDAFLKAGSLIMVTSHHGLLKNYGYTRPGCLNASVDFDGRTLEPTYRILMGVPGESHALDIAERNGLPAELVQGARAYLADERADVSALIRGLKCKHLEAEELGRKRERGLREVMEERRRVDLKELRLKQKELELRKSGAAEVRRLLEESRRGLENLVRELKEGPVTREKTLKVKDFLAGFEALAEEESGRLAAFEAEVRALEVDVDSPPVEAGGLRIESGADVLVGKARRRGRVLRPAKAGFWVVETDTARLTLPESELRPVPPSAPARPTVMLSVETSSPSQAVYELDLRGMRREEAIKALERQIDAASLTNLREFGVIHGTGEGVLKDGVREYLRSCPAVADFAFARPEDGGFGKTIVRLR